MGRLSERPPARLAVSVAAWLGWVGIFLFLPRLWQQFWRHWSTMPRSLESTLFLTIEGGTLVAALLGLPILAMSLPILWWGTLNETS
ncbi:hypothetical protein [Haladaptatus salinisoli]|uniref:hypothetical protein n=1 Tax=Haladaptatus salinisoli TaxID=2884876 RepID=UPI001D0A172A|nr:hypothetical protein [Haladaptatus salinisoli]